MTSSEKKTFLRQYGDNEIEIRRLEEEIARWESRAEKVTANYSLAPAHGEDGDKVQLAVDNITEIKSMLYDRLLDATELRRSIQTVIDTIRDERLRNLLEYRYIDGLSWKSVSEKLHYEISRIHYLHRVALGTLNFQNTVQKTTLRCDILYL